MSSLHITQTDYGGGNRQNGVMGRPRGKPAKRRWEAIGRRLIAAREALGIMSQADLRRTVKVGASQWNQFETGERRITVDIALRLKRAHGITLDWVYDGDPSRLPLKLHQRINVE